MNSNASSLLEIWALVFPEKLNKAYQHSVLDQLIGHCFIIDMSQLNKLLNILHDVNKT